MMNRSGLSKVYSRTMHYHFYPTTKILYQSPPFLYFCQEKQATPILAGMLNTCLIRHLCVVYSIFDP